MINKNNQKWLLIGGMLFGLGCCGVVVILALVIFGVGIFIPTASRSVSIGPTFTTAESLAYDVIYEGTFPDAKIETIRPFLTATEGDLTAVLSTFELTDSNEPEMHLLIARFNGREHFVAPSGAGPSGQNSQLTVDTLYHPNPKERGAELAVYGRVLDPTITQIRITWPNGWSDTVDVVDNAYLWFQAWSPVDGDSDPAMVEGLDANGEVVTAVLIDN